MNQSKESYPIVLSRRFWEEQIAALEESIPHDIRIEFVKAYPSDSFRPEEASTLYSRRERRERNESD